MNWREAVQAMLEGKKVTIINKAGEPITGYLHWPSAEKNTIWSNPTIAGYYFPSCEFEIYEEPKPQIKLGPEHVGKRVKLHNGSVYLMTGYRLGEEAPVVLGGTRYQADGKFMEIGFSHLDIVEILD